MSGRGRADQGQGHPEQEGPPGEAPRRGQVPQAGLHAVGEENSHERQLREGIDERVIGAEVDDTGQPRAEHETGGEEQHCGGEDAAMREVGDEHGHEQ